MVISRNLSPKTARARESMSWFSDFSPLPFKPRPLPAHPHITSPPHFSLFHHLLLLHFMLFHLFLILRPCWPLFLYLGGSLRVCLSPCLLSLFFIHFSYRLRRLSCTQGSLCKGKSGRSQAIMQALYNSRHPMYLRLPTKKAGSSESVRSTLCALFFPLNFFFSAIFDDFKRRQQQQRDNSKRDPMAHQSSILPLHPSQMSPVRPRAWSHLVSGPRVHHPF